MKKLTKIKKILLVFLLILAFFLFRNFPFPFRYEFKETSSSTIYKIDRFTSIKLKWVNYLKSWLKKQNTNSF